MKEVLDRIRSQAEFGQFTQELNQGTSPVKIGLVRAARLPVIAALAEGQARTILLLTQSRDR